MSADKNSNPRGATCAPLVGAAISVDGAEEIDGAVEGDTDGTSVRGTAPRTMRSDADLAAMAIISFTLVGFAKADEIVESKLLTPSVLQPAMPAEDPSIVSSSSKPPLASK